jgi:amino acid transporter
VAQEVDQPQRNYPRALLAATAATVAVYVIPLAAMAWAGIAPGQFKTGSWADVAEGLAGPWLGAAIVAGGTVMAVGMFNALMMSYARLPMVLAEDGLLPATLARKNRHGAPWMAVLSCAVGWAVALQFSFERLISLDIILYGASLMLEFAALVVLRIREPGLQRPFRAGNFAFACLIGAGPTLLLVYAGWVSRSERMAGLPALFLGALIAAGGPLFYWISTAAARRRPQVPIG